MQQGMSICPVIGEDTAVCVYYSEDICLLLAILIFQSPTLKNVHNMINSTARSDILIFNYQICRARCYIYFSLVALE